MNIVPQHVDEGKVLIRSAAGHIYFIVKDGVYFNAKINEFEVWLDDEVAGHGSTEAKASAYYLEALAQRKDHHERGNDDIPFLGEAVPMDDNYELAGVRYGLDRSEF